MNSKRELLPNYDATLWLRSCKQEITDPISGEISGVIPKWLNGVLIRNGPGSLEVGEETFQHLFDSSALLHRFKIENGEVSYQCRFLQSRDYKKNKKANRIVVTGFGTKSVPDRCRTIFQRISAAFNWKDRQSDNAMVSIYPFGDELYAFTECPMIHKINRQTLETEKRIDITDHITIVHHTSHPHVMKDGTVYNLATTIKKTGPVHNIVCFPYKKISDSTGNLSMFKEAYIVASIPARWPLHPSYMHSFGITENYFIIVEQPLSLSVPHIAIKQIQNKPIAGCFRWFKNEMTKISIISRKTGRRSYTFYSAAMFYMHIINQYELDNNIILDICSYQDPRMLEYFYTKNIENLHTNPNYAEIFRCKPIRFVLPLIETINVTPEENLVKFPHSRAKAYLMRNKIMYVKPETLCILGCEFPGIYYEKYLGRPYRYFYAMNADVDAEIPGAIIKVDTVEKSALSWREENCFPGEPVFVPKPNSQEEDDGVILAAVLFGGTDTNHVSMIVLDAKTMKELGRAEFRTSSPVPKCLHGWFLQA